MAELAGGSPERAWDLLLDRYRRLIIAAIRHYVQDYDDVMDVFARVCESLRADDFRRLRQYAEQPAHRARFSTWLVTVVHHLTIDWFRHRNGRRRVAAIALELPELQRRIFEHVFVHGRSHAETYELLRGGCGMTLSFGEFLREVAATYRRVGARRRGSLMMTLGPSMPFVSSDEVVEPFVDTRDAAAEEDRRERLASLLGTLAPADRIAVQLFVVDDLPAQEVARILGLPNAKSVYNRVYRALTSMREQLDAMRVTRSDL